MEKRIIVDDSSRDLYFLNSKTQSLRKSYDTRTLSLIIAPTTGCNFACPYCFEPKKNPKTMTREVEDRIIEYVRSRTLAENISLTWYGGEPLLAFDIIERLYDRIIAETEKKIISHAPEKRHKLISISGCPNRQSIFWRRCIAAVLRHVS